LVDKTRSHDLMSKLSSFEVRTSSARVSVVFHVSTPETGTSEVASESASERRHVQDSASRAVKRSRGDVATKSSSAAAQEILVQS